MPRKRVAPRLTFTVIYEPEDGGWCARIPSVPGCQSEGRSLREARRNIREALATCADAFDKPEKVARTAIFEEDIRLPTAERRVLRRALAARSDLEQRTIKARAELHDAAKALTSTLGLSLRDAAELLGLSHERVKQLARAKTPAKRSEAA